MFSTTNTTAERYAVWASKAAASGMTMREWVEISLDAAPVLVKRIEPAT